MDISLYRWSKWCNCYRKPNKSISIECFNNALEAISKDNDSYSQNDGLRKEESRLIRIPRLPYDIGSRYICNFLVNRAFNLPVHHL